MMNSVSDICFTNYDAVNSVMHVGNRKHYLIKNEKNTSRDDHLISVSRSGHLHYIKTYDGLDNQAGQRSFR